MLSPCLFTAPAWNGNPTPRERLECSDHTVATTRETSRGTRQRAEFPPPPSPKLGKPPCDARDIPETQGSESQPLSALGPAITKPSRRLPVETREAAVIP
ncbi:rCG44171 [Rattus norvegicus]|uniref:RCG44171 n=1 Tax=Rattus norvegicus TaxID=10116 RepID=A6J6Z4_RAT|nr:rCG44171 [Rattus norvegicus]